MALPLVWPAEPIGRPVAGAFESADINKGFGQVNRMSIGLCQSAQVLRLRDRTFEARYLTLIQEGIKNRVLLAIR